MFVRGIKIDHHVTETEKKAKLLFHTLARLGGKGWGYQAVNYNALYKVLFQSICAYAAQDCGRRLRQRHQRQLLAAQRQALIRTTKTYVSSRLSARWFVATHYITQMVTGHRAFNERFHGAFKERLYRLGLAEDS